MIFSIVLGSPIKKLAMVNMDKITVDFFLLFRFLVIIKEYLHQDDGNDNSEAAACASSCS